jgi:hypothetical protein
MANFASVFGVRRGDLMPEYYDPGTVQARPPGRIAGTNYVNELRDLVERRFPIPHTGNADSPLNISAKPVRMKIKTAADSNGVAVCNTWDGTNLGTEDINVRVFVSFKANQELWAKTVSPNAAVQKDAKDVFYIEDGTKQYQLIPVHLTQTGGVSGTNKTAKCTFTYTVKDVTDTFTLGTGVGLTGWGNGWSNLKLKLTAATKGSGYLDGGTFILTFVDEIPESEQDCP